MLLGSLGGAAFSQSDSIPYANTPPVLLPFGSFQLPYLRFFTEPVEFLGPGREKRPPSDLQEVRIGFLGPIEGSRYARLGRRMLNGATLAVEEANEAGGYNGLPFALVVRNDLGLWGASSNEMLALHEEEVWGVLGSIDGANTHIMLRIALKIDMPMVVSGDTDPTLTETAIPWMTRVSGDDRQSNYALAVRMNEMGYTRIAVLRSNDRYGRVGTGEFKDAMKRLGSPILFELRFAPGDTVFTAVLDRIHRANADAVFLWGDPEEAGLIIRQMKEMGMQQPVFGSDRLVSQEFLQIAGDAAEGVVATYLYNPTLDDPVLQSFNRRYGERFGEEAETFAAHAYDGMSMLIESIRNAGLNRVRIRDALLGYETYRGVTGTIPFDARWDDIGRIWLVEIRDGEFHFSPSPLEQNENEQLEK
jgi:ABC-type branched-subunit amino acid transport system substrate-binding protein